MRTSGAVVEGHEVSQFGAGHLMSGMMISCLSIDNSESLYRRSLFTLIILRQDNVGTCGGTNKTVVSTVHTYT